MDCQPFDILKYKEAFLALLITHFITVNSSVINPSLNCLLVIQRVLLACASSWG